MKKLNNLLKAPWAANTFALGAAVMLYLVLSHVGVILEWLGSVWRFLLPVVIGLVLAYLMDPIARFFEHGIFRKMKNEATRRTLSVTLAIVAVLAVIVLFFVAVVPSVVSSISALIGNADTYYSSIMDFLQRTSEGPIGQHFDLSKLTESVQGYVGKLLNSVTSNMQSILAKAGSIGTSVFNWVVGLIIAIYFMLDKASLLPGFNDLRRAAMTQKRFEIHNGFWHRCDEIFIQYIGCNLLDALIVGTLTAIFMLILGMPYVSLISVVVGVTNLLPTFGPIVGGVICAFVLVLNKPVFALYFIIFAVVVQGLDAYVIKPKLFSNSLGIPAVWTLVAIILGGKLFGVVGMLLAIPVAAVLVFLYHEQFIPWLQRRSAARELREKQENDLPEIVEEPKAK